MKNDFAKLLTTALVTVAGFRAAITNRADGKNNVFAAARGLTDGVDLKKVPQAFLGAVTEVGFGLAEAVNEPVQKLGQTIKATVSYLDPTRGTALEARPAGWGAPTPAPRG